MAETQEEKPQVLIEVFRGMVTSIHATDHMEITFVDWDAAERGDDIVTTFSQKTNRNQLRSRIELIKARVKMMHQRLKQKL